LIAATDAISSKIGEWLKTIERQREEIKGFVGKSETVSKHDVVVDEADVMQHTNRNLRKDLVAAEDNVKRLKDRKSELEQVTSDVQKSLAWEQSEHEKTKLFSRELEVKQQRKYDDLKVKFDNAGDKISELEDKLRLCLKKNSTSEKRLSNENHSWEIEHMRSSHDNEIKELKTKNEGLAKQLMQLQDTNAKLLETLVNRDAKSKEVQKNGGGYNGVVANETEAMKKAYEIRHDCLKKQLELARLEAANMKQQLQEQLKSRRAAINARSMLQQFEKTSI